MHTTVWFDINKEKPHARDWGYYLVWIEDLRWGDKRATFEKAYWNGEQFIGIVGFITHWTVVASPFWE